MRIAMLGTRGVPAAHGGLETAVEEIGRRLVLRGHHVLVYGDQRRPELREHLGMRLVHVPAVQQAQLEAVSRTGIAAVLAALEHRIDAAFLFGIASAPLVPVLRARGIPVAVHVDGLERHRDRWSGAGRAYYRWAQRRAVRSADVLIADAPGMVEHYREAFGVPTTLLRYGAPILEDVDRSLLAPLGLVPGAFHLVVARLEPENHVLEVVQGFRRSTARLPLVVVGSTPYNAGYAAAVRAAAAGDDRIRLLGAIADQPLLDALYASARTYLHGHSLGGTNPSLLRAMGAGAAIAAYDVSFNREVLDSDEWTFRGPDDVARILARAEADEEFVGERGLRARTRAALAFRWDDVALGYERLAWSLRREAVHGVARHAHRLRPRAVDSHILL